MFELKDHAGGEGNFLNVPHLRIAVRRPSIPCAAGHSVFARMAYDLNSLPMVVFLLISACANLPFFIRSLRDVFRRAEFSALPAAPAALLTTSFAEVCDPGFHVPHWTRYRARYHSRSTRLLVGSRARSCAGSYRASCSAQCSSSMVMATGAQPSPRLAAT